MGGVDMTAVEALHVALQQSFSPDSNVRDPAEAAIKNLKNVPGATNMLLHITEERQVSESFCALASSITIDMSLAHSHTLHTSIHFHIFTHFRSNMKFAKLRPFS